MLLRNLVSILIATYPPTRIGYVMSSRDQGTVRNPRAETDRARRKTTAARGGARVDCGARLGEALGATTQLGEPIAAAGARGGSRLRARW
ncbi:MAG: hypothetical protein K1X88_29170 [Nannocystaceae bacterium]|nr:hypothetical protein [Nannocystaceae bacterium]